MATRPAVLVSMMLCLGGGPGLAGCGTATDAVDGPRVFASMCATCHGDRGKPSEAMAARLGVRDLTAAEFRARVTPALVEKQVRGGSANKLMPAFAGALSEAQIASVAGYVADAGFVR